MKLAFIAMHPAPYRDEFIGRLVREAGFTTDVFLVTPRDKGHDFSAPSYPFSTLRLRTMGRIAFGDYDHVVFPAFLPLRVLVLLFWRALRRRPYALCADTIERRTPYGGGRTLKRLLARRADFILVPGRRAARFVAREYGVPPERILTGMYAFATERLAQEIAAYRAARGSLRAACGIGADEKVFLMVANMIPTRQYPLVAAAFTDFAAAHPKTRFVMCGKGADLPRMESFAAAHPCLTVIPGRSFEEMKKLYAMADVYVHGGAEPASTALVIGAIAGLPLVTSAAVGCADDVLMDGETGVLVTDPLSRSAWTDAFGRIAALESRWPALGSAAHTAARSLDLDEVYGKVLANLQPAAFDSRWRERKSCKR